MKSIYLAATVLVVLVAGAIGCSFYVNDIAKDLGMYAMEISSEIEEGDYESAKNAANELDEEIERKKTLLCAVVDHKEIYEIKRSLGELKCYIEDEEKADSLAHCAAISSVSEKISDNSLPYIFNIL